MQAQHTPTPWENLGSDTRQILCSTRGHCIAEIFPAELSKNASPEDHALAIATDKANAAFIVTAVNNHDALAGLVEGMLRSLELVQSEGFNMTRAALRKMDEARAVLAAVKSKG